MMANLLGGHCAGGEAHQVEEYFARIDAAQREALLAGRVAS